MGRYSSDSEEDKKKRKKKKKKRSRSRSRSVSIESRHSTKQKKSKKSKKKYKSRSRSRSTDRYRRSRSSSRGGRSYDRYRSRSRSRERYRKRSLSRGRYSRSRSRERRRRRSRSYEKSSRRSRSYSPSRKDRKKRSSLERDDPCANIPGFSDMMPAEQAKIRMQMALKAAAAADEKLKGEGSKSQPSISLQDQLAFSLAVDDIEGASFSASTFKSSRGDKREEKSNNKEEFLFGTAGELRLDMSQRKPVIINVDTDELAHPSFYADPEEKLDRWIQKLSNMRRKKLEGEALT